MRLDLDSLYTEARPDGFNGAKKIFYDNKVWGVGIAVGSDKITLSGTVGETDGEKETFSPSIHFGLSGDLYDYKCMCGRDSMLDGPCEHILAVALSYEEKNPAILKSETITDAAALKAIAFYSERRVRITSDVEKQHLSPVLFTADGRAAIRLTVGAKRYKVKNIALMLSKIERREFHRYGLDCGFFHSKEKFDDKSKRLVELLIASTAEKNRLGIKDDFKDVFFLLQNDVDLFFELYEGETVGIYDGIEQSVRVFESVDALRTVMKVMPSDHSNNEGGFASKNNREGLCDCHKNNDDGLCDCQHKGGFKISLASRPDHLVYGRKYAYNLSSVGVYKCSFAFLDCVLPLVQLMQTKQEIFVSAKDMPMFYNNVIFKTSEFIDIQSDCDLSVYQMPDLEARLYISRQDRGIEGRLECFYGKDSADIFGDFYADTLLRDWQQEAMLKETILRYFPLAPLLRLEEEADIYGLAAFGLADIGRFAEILIAEDSLLKIRRHSKISVGIKLSGGLLDVSIGGELTKQELKEIMKGLKSGRKYVRMADGSFVSLGDPLFAPLSRLSSLGGGETEFSVPKYYAPYFEEELSSGFIQLEKSEEFKQLLSKFLSYNSSELPMPESLDGVLRSYQKTGVRWLNALCENGFGGILADDMGLGKSLQLITLLLSKNSFPCLIVCPTTLILNWAAEFARFAPNLRLLKVMGLAAQRENDLADLADYDVIITSYKLLSRDISLYESIQFEVAAADEAQFIKNPETASARAIKRIKSHHRFALTGTPIENKLSELWSIFDFVMPRYLGTYAEFSRRFELPLLSGDKRATNELIALTSPFVLRRMKSEVLTELPPKIETEMLCPLEDEQKEAYYRTLVQIKESLNIGRDYSVAGDSGDTGTHSIHSGGGRMAVLAGLTKLRQICCDPKLVDQFYNGNSAKTEMCIQLVTDAIEGGHKVLLFSQFTSMLEILRTRLEQIGASYYLLKGDTPKPERMRMANRFNEGDTNVFLISLKAGGTGLNLIGADVVILYDPWWNDPVMNQATDRAYRLGQDKSVHVYKLIMQNSIEQKIRLLQQKKNALSGLLVDKSENLNMDKLLELLD